MHIGEQVETVSDAKLTWAAQLGVEHLAVNNPECLGIVDDDGRWNLTRLRAAQSRLADYGMSLDVLSLPIRSDAKAQHRFPGIMRGLPSRDAEIELLAQHVRTAGEAGVPCLKYGLNLLGILRTGRVRGRGGALYSHFDMEEWEDASLTPAGPMPATRMWEVIEYFLERIVPVAEESGVRLACHPHDPAVRPSGVRGIVRVLGSVDGLKKLIDVVPSTYSGLTFCVGSIAEMLVDPAREIPDVIRYFGARHRIFMVHYRNIVGGYLRFNEVYPDNGDMDFHALMTVFREVGYRGMFCPDHVPLSDVDPDEEKQRAFCLGYIRGLIQAVTATDHEAST